MARVASTIVPGDLKPQDEDYDAQIVYAIVIASLTLVEQLVIILIIPKKAPEPGWPAARSDPAHPLGRLAARCTFTGPFVRTSVATLLRIAFMTTVATMRQRFRGAEGGD